MPGFKQYMTLMAELSGRYQRAQMLRQMTGQQQLWTQLEAFARQVHGSLKPKRSPTKSPTTAGGSSSATASASASATAASVSIEAISGADVVEKRSNAVRLMRKLCQARDELGRETRLQRHTR